MKKSYGVNELRRMYLEFFESKGHLAMKSFSLVPHNDNSLLLINAGMAPLKPYFTGQEVPPRRRVTTCQKCVRTGDIENVGKTARHLTFFEMLGNFSFGDYFKHEAIAWSWEFLTEVLGLEKDRLYPSIYGEDDEAFDIWTKEVGVPGDRITRFYRDPETGECDNFWEHGAGPCGPCSEIYYDRGEKYGCGKPDCKVGCDCDRFMEVWNNVFTQFNGDGHGGYTELEHKNIDTGMGLERLAVVMQDVDSVFDIDTMKAIRDKVCELSGKKYHVDEMDGKFNPEFWNYAKLISGVLRYGMPIDQVIKLVQGMELNNESINTWKNGVERALKKYLPNGTEAKGQKCPNCGHETLVYQEGCLICTNCGASRCG